MKKGLKKGLKITGITFGVLIVLMIITPFIFKNKIKNAVISSANKDLNAKLDIKDFGLNLFSHFPSATISLDDMSLSGINEFKGDTLVKAKSVSMTINLMSIFGSNYKVSRIILDQADIHAKILANGKANWQIMKDTTTSAPAQESAENTPVNLSLKDISLNNCNVVYDDQTSSNMKVVIKKWNGNLSGDFTAKTTTLKTSSTIDELSFIMDGIPYISKARASADATLNADMAKMKFTFIDSKLQLNDVKASIDGSVAMVGATGKDFDLKLNAPNTQFKDLLSLVPAMYTADFKDVKASGTASLSAYIKGVMDTNTYPAFNFEMKVNNGMFQYPSLPKAVTAVNVDIQVDHKIGSLDNTLIDINKLGFNIGGNPFSARMNISTPISDPNIKAQMNGTLDLAMIKDVYPLEQGVALNGKLVANLNLAARASAIKKEEYKNITASGNLNLSNMTYTSKGNPDILINNADLAFTPQWVNLSAFNMKMGKNDIEANGKLENLIAFYVLKNQTLKGTLNVQSTFLDIDNLTQSTMAATPTTSGAASSKTTPVAANSAPFVIPQNIDFTLSANFKQVIYDKINITNLGGQILVQNGILTLKNISANALGGVGKMSGTYNSAVNPKKPEVNMAINLNQVSFAETFKSVESIQKMVPIFNNLKGTYSMTLNAKTTLGQTNNETLSTLTGDGLLQTSDVSVQNIDAFNKLSSALGTSALKSFEAKNVKIPFAISNGRIATQNFNINFGGQGKLNLSGSTGLDQTIDYKGNVTLPQSMANNLINNIPITIKGTFSSPKIGVDTKSLVSSAAQSLLSNTGNSTVNAVAGAVTDKKQQAALIRKNAQIASDQLVANAQKQGQALVNAAGGNPLKKMVAEQASKKLVASAQQQGKKITDEADVKAKELEAGQ